MFDYLKNDIHLIIKTNKKSYIPILKKRYIELYNWLNDLGFDSFGENLYNWLYPSVNSSCKVCGGRCKFKQFSHGYFDYCSCSCRAIDKKSFKNAHLDDGSSKAKDALKLNYAVRGSEIVETRRSTFLETHGVTLNEFLSRRNRESFLNTLPDCLHNREYCAGLTGSATQIASAHSITVSAVRTIFSYHTLDLPNTKDGRSKDEKEIANFILSLGVEIECNVTNLLGDKREIDIYIPSLNIGIEYCGLFWHSDRNNYPKLNHITKWSDARARGITLITIFEDEWIFKPDIVKARLRSILGKNEEKVFARKCTVTSISGDDVGKLLNSWHINGARSNKNNISLIHNGDIVAILTYGKPRYSNAELEIIRYATKPNCTVIGGFSKLLSSLIKKVNPSSVVSYSDNRWGLGGLYEKTGFTKINTSVPSYYYFIIKDKVRFHRSAFMKHKIINSMNGKKELSEYENMKEFGYNRIFDCGATTWLYIKEEV